jgi:hypothetical protein
MRAVHGAHNDGRPCTIAVRNPNDSVRPETETEIYSSNPRPWRAVRWPSSAGENIVWSHSSYATMLLIQKFQILSDKKYWNKFVDVHKMCPHNSCKFWNQNRNVLRETIKTNCYVNSIILIFCLFVTLFMFDFSFLFLLVYFEFGSENFRDCKDVSCEHPQFYSKFFCHLHFEILKVVSW